MLATLLPLGAVPLTGRLASWALMQLAEKARPFVETFVHDPTGSISRIGDLLVWQGASGQQVIGTLEAMSDNQERIEQVVGRIETAQIGLTGSLGMLTSLSMATLGVTSLAAGFMVWRMNALLDRVNKLSDQLSDILANLQTMHEADLLASLKHLDRFEAMGEVDDLRQAKNKATDATEKYRLLVQREMHGQKRLLSLNACGRYYLLSLTAQARCQILANQLKRAEQELASEKRTLTALATVTFTEVMGKSPEVYLDPKLQADHVTLDLVTEVYQQAHQLGAVSAVEFKDAGQTFEYFRPKIYAASSWFRPGGRAKDKLLTKLKYLMACLEEVSRIESLRLRITEAIQGRLSFQELEQAVIAAKDRPMSSPGSEAESSVVAFAFAPAKQD